MASPQQGEESELRAMLPPAPQYQAILATMLGDVYEAIMAASRLQGEVAKNGEQFHILENLISHLARERAELQAAAAKFEGVIDRLDDENERFVKLHRSTLDAMRSELEYVARKQKFGYAAPWLIAVVLAGLIGFLLGRLS